MSTWRVETCDYREIVPELRGVASVITDPPYGISHPCNFGARGRGNLAKCNDYADVCGDNEPFEPSMLLEMGLPTVFWGGNHFADKLPASGGWLVWDKERPDTLDQATCELAWTNCVKGVRRFRHLWNGMMRASEHGENYHPTQKPVALMRWLLSLPWIPRGTVFDPFCGSGPVGVACVQLGFDYIGCDLNPTYTATARRRIGEAASTLWTPPEPAAVQAAMFDDAGASALLPSSRAGA